jgi:hypothetical protein
MTRTSRDGVTADRPETSVGQSLKAVLPGCLINGEVSLSVLLGGLQVLFEADACRGAEH